jgi:hypothetical protein
MTAWDKRLISCVLTSSEAALTLRRISSHTTATRLKASLVAAEAAAVDADSSPSPWLLLLVASRGVSRGDMGDEAASTSAVALLVLVTLVLVNALILEDPARGSVVLPGVLVLLLAVLYNSLLSGLLM